MTSLFDLKDKNAIITGSSKGIGKAIAYRMAEHGARVIITSRKIDACEEVANEINNQFGADKAKAIAVTGAMDRNIWVPIVVRNTAALPTSESTITGEVGIQTLGDEDNADGNLFRVDALEIREGFYAGNFVGPQQIRKGGEISWDVID